MSFFFLYEVYSVQVSPKAFVEVCNIVIFLSCCELIIDADDFTGYPPKNRMLFYEFLSINYVKS